MGYFDIPKDLLIPITEVDNYPKNEVIIIATGMQRRTCRSLKSNGAT